jgi:hypothetical protein
MSPEEQRDFIRPSGSFGTLSTYLSNTVSTSDSGSRAGGGGPGERIIRGVLGWVIGKVYAVSSNAEVDGMKSASLGSVGAIPSVGSTMSDEYHQRDRSAVSSFANITERGEIY